MTGDNNAFRRHPLTSEELKALDLYVPTISKGGGNHRGPPEQLRNMILPLHQAVDKLYYVPIKGQKTENPEWFYANYKRKFKSCVMREMVERRTGYWEWSSEQWREVILGVKHGPRLGVIAATYSLCGVATYHNCPTHISRPRLYQMIFGEAAWHNEVAAVRSVLRSWHFACLNERRTGFGEFEKTMAYVLLDVGGRTKDITFDALVAIERREGAKPYLIAISQALNHLGVIDQCLSRHRRRGQREATTDGVSLEWLTALESWRATSTSREKFKTSVMWAGLKAGRWLNTYFPEVKRPEDWTPLVNTNFLAAVHAMKVGDYVSETSNLTQSRIGKPLLARSKASLIDHLRLFFSDLQRKKLVVNLQINPEVDLEMPKSIKNLFGPDPRDIEKETWLKIVWASLNLTDEDCQPYSFPLELLQAIAVVWTHCGLRSSEIIRLPVGCVGPIRPAKKLEREELGLPNLGTLVCELMVPTHKTGPSFHKAVPKVVETTIRAWEAVRSENPKDLDDKTGKDIDYLFTSFATQATLSEAG